MPAKPNKDRCISCGGCTSVCPVNALELRGNEIHVDKEKCIECGACTELCPVGAIKIKKEKENR